jgi:Domain of Unknown Function (DUF1080)
MWTSVVQVEQSEQNNEVATSGIAARRRRWFRPSVAIGGLVLGLVAVWASVGLMNHNGLGMDENKSMREFLLFNGRDLTGWKPLFQNGSSWKVIDSVLEGRGGGDRNPAYLVTQRTNFANFRLHLKFRYETDGSGNIEIRRSPVGNNRSCYNIHHGLWPTSDRWQIPVGTVVKLVNKSYGPGGGVESKNAKPTPAPLKSWVSLDILAVKNRITVSVNGERVVEYTDSSGWFGGGEIALNAWPLSAVRFQEITIEELPE